MTCDTQSITGKAGGSLIVSRFCEDAGCVLLSKRVLTWAAALGCSGEAGSITKCACEPGRGERRWPCPHM